MIDDASVPPPRRPSSIPPLVLSCVLMAVGLGWWATLHESFGYAFVLGIPVLVGFTIGYYGDASPAVKTLQLVASVGLALTVAWLLAVVGPTCALVALAVILGPALLGLLAGVLVRRHRSRRPPRTLGAGLALLVTVALPLEAALTTRSAPELIRTTRVLDLDRSAAWNAIAFYAAVPTNRKRPAALQPAS